MDDKDYQNPFKLTAKLDKLTIELEPPKLTPGDEKKLRDARARASEAQ